MDTRVTPQEARAALDTIDRDRASRNRRDRSAPLVLRRGSPLGWIALGFITDLKHAWITASGHARLRSGAREPSHRGLRTVATARAASASARSSVGRQTFPLVIGGSGRARVPHDCRLAGRVCRRCPPPGHDREHVRRSDDRARRAPAPSVGSAPSRANRQAMTAARFDELIHAEHAPVAGRRCWRPPTGHMSSSVSSRPSSPSRRERCPHELSTIKRCGVRPHRSSTTTRSASPR